MMWVLGQAWANKFAILGINPSILGSNIFDPYLCVALPLQPRDFMLT